MHTCTFNIYQAKKLLVETNKNKKLILKKWTKSLIYI